MKGLVLMGTPGCSGCVLASNWLEGRGIPFRKYDVSTDVGVIRWLIETTGQRVVPQFFIDGELVTGGFEGLRRRLSKTPRVTQL